MKVVSLVFEYDLEKQRKSRPLWGKEGYRNKDYIFEYTAASIATFLHHNPHIKYDVNTDDVSLLEEKISKYDVSTENLNIIDSKDEIEEWKKHDYCFYPAMLHYKNHIDSGEKIIKLDNDLTCLKPIDELVDFEGALIWQTEFKISEGKEKWGEKLVARKVVGTEDFYSHNIGVFGLSEKYSHLVDDMIDLSLKMVNVDISDVVFFKEEPGYKCKIWSCSEQTAYSYILDSNDVPIRQVDDFFNHHCYGFTAKDNCIKDAEYLLKEDTLLTDVNTGVRQEWAPTTSNSSSPPMFLKNSIGDGWATPHEWITKYKNVCIDICNNENKFNTFKKNPDYMRIVSNLTPELANYYFDVLMQHPLILDNPDKLKYFSKFRSSIEVGGPEISKGPLGLLDYRIIRYALVLLNLEVSFETLDNLNIVEIGGGYGEQCKLINDIYNFNSYTFYDLSEGNRVSEKYLSNFDITGDVKYKTQSDLLVDNQQYDIVISNYAFSELNKPTQDFYIENLFSKCKFGYITYNWMRGLNAPAQPSTSMSCPYDNIEFLELCSSLNIANPNFTISHFNEHAPGSECEVIIWMK